MLISRHRDGEFNAIAAERLGIGTIRGSGDHGSAFHRKGGVGAFKEMVRALEDKYNVAMTADVPKRSRVAGLGVIMLARESGRPIMPFAMATSRFIRLEKLGPHHHQSAIRAGCIGGSERSSWSRRMPMPGPWKNCARNWRLTLNEATRRAYAQVGRPEGQARGSWLTPCR